MPGPFSLAANRATVRAMKQTLMTRDGTPISRFCFGAMQFGRNADDAAAAEMFAACRKTGINFFDTAHVYNDGRSEEMLGRLAATDRDKLFIATKCANGDTSDRALIHNQFDQSLNSARHGQRRSALHPHVERPDPAGRNVRNARGASRKRQ